VLDFLLGVVVEVSFRAVDIGQTDSFFESAGSISDSHAHEDDLSAAFLKLRIVGEHLVIFTVFHIKERFKR
jgi:hypothetical protein